MAQQGLWSSLSLKRIQRGCFWKVSTILLMFHNRSVDKLILNMFAELSFLAIKRLFVTQHANFKHMKSISLMTATKTKKFVKTFNDLTFQHLHVCRTFKLPKYPITTLKATQTLSMQPKLRSSCSCFEILCEFHSTHNLTHLRKRWHLQTFMIGVYAALNGILEYFEITNQTIHSLNKHIVHSISAALNY